MTVGRAPVAHNPSMISDLGALPAGLWGESCQYERILTRYAVSENRWLSEYSLS
jgi:hypothetical protein